MYRPIFLIGFMGSGKSTVGRRLADQLGFRFIDTDTFIETRFRQRIVDMFASLGEEVFRRRERVIIEELMSMEDTVFATGGGLPCHGDTMELLNASGETVYFRCSSQILSLRLELLSFTQETLAHREPIYSQAKHTFDIDLIDTPEKEEAFACQLAQHKPLLVKSDWG